jgi:hypothetical protein
VQVLKKLTFQTALLVSALRGYNWFLERNNVCFYTEHGLILRKASAQCFRVVAVLV